MSSEGNSLGLDLDPFDDIVPPPAISIANAGGKFKPRAKPRPNKGKHEAIAIAASNTTMDDNASLASITGNLQSAKFVDVGDSKVVDSVSSSLTNLDNMVAKEPSGDDDYANPGILLSNDDRSSGLAKSMGVNADIFSEFENIQDIVTQSQGNAEIPVPPSNQDTEEQSRFSAHNSANSSALRACNVVNLDAVTSNEAAIQINNGRQEPSLHLLGECRLNQSYSLTVPDVNAAWKKPDPLFNLESPDIQSKSTFASQHSARKFQPKPKVQTGKERPNISILPLDAVESVLPPPNAQFTPSETVCINEGSFPTIPADDVLYYSSISSGNVVTPEPTMSEFPVNAEQINLTDASHSCDPIVLQENVTGVPEMENSKSRKRKYSSVSNLAENSKRSLAGGMNENGKSSMQLRRRTSVMQLVDESEDDEAHTGNGVPPGNSVADEEDNDCDYRVDEENDNEAEAENTSYENRASEKSKQCVTEKLKPVRRRKKKNNDALEQSTQEPRKKFSHSTRRKSRLKDLLKIPEDEVDFRNMPFKDIILLAGYKESLAVKEAKASKDASANRSTSDSFHGEGFHNEEDANPSDQDGCYTDQSNLLFNSHSFMDKTPIARWSKLDTELFYEGIRQFGTDLSMIQQLFPGRTRHQIKLKYKKEERQHPLRLSEALNSRAKDNSYFEKVIEQLKVAAQAEQEANKGDSAGMTDEEMELDPKTNEEVAKSEQHDGAAVEEYEGNASKYEEDEDDDEDIWNSY